MRLFLLFLRQHFSSLFLLLVSHLELGHSAGRLLLLRIGRLFCIFGTRLSEYLKMGPSWTAIRSIDATTLWVKRSHMVKVIRIGCYACSIEEGPSGAMMQYMSE